MTIEQDLCRGNVTYFDLLNSVVKFKSPPPYARARGSIWKKWR